MGREMSRRRKSHNQPRIILISSSLPSAHNLCIAAMLSRGIGSSAATRREHVSIASRGAASDRLLLLQPGKSNPRPTRSSIKMSCVPRSLILTSTMSSRPCSKGMSSGRNIGVGKSIWFGAWRSSGFQFSSSRRAVARSHIVSEITPHSKGHGVPPKVRRRDISANSSWGSCVQLCFAVFELICRRRNADLKSIFVAYILVVGYFLLAATAQFTNRLTTPP